MDGHETLCRAKVGLARCSNQVLAPDDVCAFHAGLQGAWAEASLRRPLMEELRARFLHPPRRQPSEPLTQATERASP